MGICRREGQGGPDRESAQVRGARMDPRRGDSLTVATDLDEIVRNLTSFYDFTGKTVAAGGAAGGQLAESLRAACGVIAIDRDEAALERLLVRARERSLAERFTLVPHDLLAVHPRGDVVLFEFCLHEMSDPQRALGHAAGLAPDLLV